LLCAALGPTAPQPLTMQYFSIDLASPTTGGGFAAADLLSAPGPTVGIAAANLGLGSPNDELDGVSFDNASVSGSDTFVVIFSVDRSAVGAVAPDPGLVAAGRPFNVQQQAGLNQEAGDAFMSLLLFDRSGIVPPGPKPVRPAPAANNTQVVNQGDAGGVDYSLGPPVSPTYAVSPFASIDEVDAGAGTSPSGAHPLRPTSAIFFSLNSSSPSLATLPGTNSGADVYVDTNPANPGGQQLYAAPFMLGLQPDDDIDALTVFDDGDLVFEVGADQVIFSLSPESPSLSGDASPGDLFTSQGGGVFTLYAAAGDLGLDTADNLDMMDYALCDDPLSCALDWAIGWQHEPAGPPVYQPGGEPESRPPP